MRGLLLCVILFFIPESAFALKSLFCTGPVDDFQCFGASNYASQDDATRDAKVACARYFGTLANKWCVGGTVHQGNNMCDAVADYQGHAYIQSGSTPAEAQEEALAACNRYLTGPCKVILTICDGTADQEPYPKLITSIQGPPPWWRFYDPLRAIPELFNMGALGAGISFGIGLVISLLIYAKRAAIANLIIHGNLPFKLSNYADDIEVLFKRTQRVNWYGLVVFGVVARLGMTEAQLALVRRYWLGRVIAFDSLRRQQQNQLALMHLQLAASSKTDAKDSKPLSQVWAAIRGIFYLFRALFSFLFGFLFIRVTIAKLARGKLIESANLVLILQAKEAIEQSARYLKEYLVTAETFNGQEELYEPERPVDTVVSPLHRRGQTQP